MRNVPISPFPPFPVSPITLRRVIRLTRYQWTVFLAAWLGWGFDIFDGLLFNFVAPNALPTLLGVPIGGDAAQAAQPYGTGNLN